MSLILKALGLLDLAAASALFLASSDVLPTRLVLTLGAMLALKGVGFKGDPVSIFDIILGLYVLITIAFNIKLLSILFGVYLAFKGLYSLF